MQEAFYVQIYIHHVCCSFHSLEHGTNEINEKQSHEQIATFAGGCFWCVEEAFEQMNGVREVISGFSGGNRAQPDLPEVSAGKTGHTESVQVYYDPNIVSYAALLQKFWRIIDPTDNKGQFVDRGQQYHPEIFDFTPINNVKLLSKPNNI